MMPLQKVKGFTKPSSTLTTEWQVSKAKVSARERHFSIFFIFPPCGGRAIRFIFFLGQKAAPRKRIPLLSLTLTAQILKSTA